MHLIRIELCSMRSIKTTRHDSNSNSTFQKEQKSSLRFLFRQTRPSSGNQDERELPEAIWISYRRYDRDNDEKEPDCYQENPAAFC